MKQLVMGNQAMGLAALHAGVGFASGYPGTPSTEVLETIAKNPGNTYVEWSVNEKAALEVAAGAALSGVRSLVTMKQVGLNVASDPIMSLAYIGVKGGMVVLVADDPGPISSQTEQDTRTFARFSKLPIFDPASPQEAYTMMGDAFALSEKYQTPVLFRPTTRLCHASADIDFATQLRSIDQGNFQKDPKWVIFPKLSHEAHRHIEERNPQIGEEFSSYCFNTITGVGRLGIATGGISYAYTQDALHILHTNPKMLRIATPFPFPESLALRFLKEVDTVLVLEELDPVIERELIYLAGKHHIDVKILGKLSGHMPTAGENSIDTLLDGLRQYLHIDQNHEMEMKSSLVGSERKVLPDPPTLPPRPPVLCAGCPHRSSFFAVKQAVKSVNQKNRESMNDGAKAIEKELQAIYCGDIGCYTLGNASPLYTTDTCLCMGAGITMAQGLARVNDHSVCFAFVGDSTFFASGITGVVNAVYNRANLVLVILDNSLTAMTGGQPHPGIGKSITNALAPKLSIEAIIEAMGVEVTIADPLDLAEAIGVVEAAIGQTGVRAVIFRSPCVSLIKGKEALFADSKRCIGCGKCVRELGCPALSIQGAAAVIDSSLCNGCSLCAQICPTSAIF
ncbi:MAG: indolepyruvate ferredoxin oxidoreductase subunit alpha [Clostridium sp.]|jgi:indolepyruvate ferredoxin oxidoreductase alpha subunit|nr:indolepyruvate ferredoxin oxidoreductase subunit alpha [Clostridium sp.]